MHGAKVKKVKIVRTQNNTINLGRVRTVPPSLRLSGLTLTANHPDMQKIWIIGFSFEYAISWQMEVEKKFLQTAVVGYMFISSSSSS
jgi:hypothetical protein